MKILIVGAGIAGLSLFHKLKNGKHDIEIIEKSETMRLQGAGICLPANAMAGFEKLGFKDDILKHAHQVTEVRFEKASRKLLSKASLLESPLNIQPFVALERNNLMTILNKGLENNIQYNRFISTIKQSQNTSRVIFNDGTEKEYDLIIAADGINSDTRKKVFDSPNLLDLKVSNWRFCIDYPNHKMQPSYLLGKNDLFMFYPISKNRLYCYGQISDPTGEIFELDSKEAMKKVFVHYEQSVQNAIFNADTIIKGQLKSVESREVFKNNVLLIGDALHGCPPSLQQGVGMALEDVLLLAQLIETDLEPNEILNEFKNKRLKRISWVIDESNKVIKLAEMGKSFFGRLLRNSIVRKTGPQNVKGWRKLLTEEV
ncbi:FAD-dependent monooxygenase [Pseudoalteromonas denitrificans]|jgi:2-polyprenyl-6-methoxyphenol hydroxylase-like FAD-dependent oxidoreductase|uniref:2-polyprenyl-6-methoxyphenol hydroxylase n=1 Tax=Pseudoalteromonas denitrificans DSM 6059 TaxID=1123010 RepID=A0A1I1I4K0_9GAMM|nr:FAD-dependent monooxygenase [Pseudoalteromonas denitrificans]SFC31134.1 2-polyprenyl-6-methoxyphenol hydroxylase [Pseudoalteromonas denitrificans DSM 6059]